jgi:hypothetical protein
MEFGDIHVVSRHGWRRTPVAPSAHHTAPGDAGGAASRNVGRCPWLGDARATGGIGRMHRRLNRAHCPRRCWRGSLTQHRLGAFRATGGIGRMHRCLNRAHCPRRCWRGSLTQHRAVPYSGIGAPIPKHHPQTRPPHPSPGHNTQNRHPESRQGT